MRYRKDNIWYNLAYVTVSPLVNWTVAQRIKRSIKHAIVVENVLNLTEFSEVPKIKIERKNKFEYILKIQNISNKHDVIKMSHLALSGSLRGRLERFELSQGHDVNGGNFIEFQVNDVLKNWQFRPSKISDFKNDFGIIKIDNRLSIDITKSSHFVISGSTGTGKSTLFLSLLAQMLYFRNGKSKPDLFIVDFKNGELARLAKQSNLPKNHFSDGVNGSELLNIFENIDDLMNERQRKQLHKRSFTVTSEHDGFSPVYVVLEEFGSGIALQDKKTQEAIKKYIAKIAMQGRSSLVCLVILSQQASVQGTGLTSAVIDQMSNKFLMGQTTPTQRTYIMSGFDLPDKAWAKGSGKGYYYSDDLLVPYEFIGAFPADEMADDWLFKVLKSEINAIYR